MTDNQEQLEASTSRESYLSVLSEAQYDAVTASPDEPLQILAGPGSGKTRVLVSRVAWLILEKNVNPRDLVVVTFTNKAANEMKERLTKLIGKERTANLVLGTFHATCARYLRSHAAKVGMKNNFSICDTDDQQSFFKKLIKDNPIASNAAKTMYPTKLTPSLCMNEISKAKAKNVRASEYKSFIEEIENTAELQKKWTNKKLHQVMITIYDLYEKHLWDNNSLDFDDLLMFGLKLFSEHGKVIANVRHVLVDEFQDTNLIQYALMSNMAGRSGSRGSVSIVGDPDQSIYGWRSAEVGNLETMAQEFAAWTKAGEIKRVFLEENYRSTGRILEVAKAVIEGSSSRIERGLFTSHKAGPKVVLANLQSEVTEASFIATEIKRLIACSGGLYTFDDFAILLRFNALSRNVEQQLLHENIPCRILGGARFFERKEVKDLLAYLTLADNPYFEPALDRVINVPKRKIGDASLSSLKGEARRNNISTMELIEQFVIDSKKFPDLRGLQKSKLAEFSNVVRTIRQMGQNGDSVDKILFTLIELTKFEEHLRKEADFEQRWENVKELINFSTMVMRGIGVVSDSEILENEEEPQTQSTYLTSLMSQINQSSAKQLPKEERKSQKKKKSQAPGNRKSATNVIDLLSSSDEEEETKLSKAEAKVVGEDDDDEGVDEKTPLQLFIESCTLSTDIQEDEDDKNGKKAPKVTIATAHAAKGLEFPVVFVLSVESDTYPFYRSQETQEQIDEETRLLYVAITRAQTLCYLTYADQRTVFGEEREKNLSPFIARIADSKQFNGGAWNEVTSNIIDLDGGYVQGPETSTKKKPKKVDFGDDRPSLSIDDIKIFCAILNRPEPPKERLDKLTNAYKSSDYAKRANEIGIGKFKSKAKPTKRKDSSYGGDYSKSINKNLPTSFTKASQLGDFSSFNSRDLTSSNTFRVFSAGPVDFSQPSFGFSSASSLLAKKGGSGNPLKPTNQNVYPSDSSQKGSGKRLGTGRAPTGAPTMKKSKKD